jgi:putative ABC transport system permease protein
VESLANDVRLAVRTLGSRPGFSLNVIASLALGFAVVSTTVAIAHAYLIRPLPYPAAADRVYYVRYAPIGPWEPGGLSGMNWSSVSDVIEFPLASANETFYVAGPGSGHPRQPFRGRRITYGILAGLPFQPLAGRTLTADDFRRSAEPNALIAERAWRDRYGARSEAVGQVIQTETQDGRRETFRIAGVLPA